MTRHLDPIFRELGLSQYLDAFVDQGFDSWDTILDIQESDLDALGVKLGHRRKLQRRIANARGIAPSVFLPSTVKASLEDAKQEGVRPEQGKTETNNETAGVVKRKYRRHPKPDENAPERPPSAYVLFSNKMRDDLKHHNLTFTEIAKLVGENWQSLPPAEKEAYEGQANAAKEKYHRDLSEYKKTPQYRKYAQYLQEFKERQAKQNSDSKRTKLEPARLRHGSSSSSATPASGSGSGSMRGSRSSSERMQGSEPPPARQERVNSIESTAESHQSLPGLGFHQHRISLDEPNFSPRTEHFEMKNGRDAPPMQQQSLPSLSDVLDDGRIGCLPIAPQPEGSPYLAHSPHHHRRPLVDAQPAILPARVPVLRHEGSSSGSSGSGSSASSLGRPLGDGPLPIHALLSNRPPAPYEQSPSPTFSNGPNGSSHGPRGYGFQSAPSALQHLKIEESDGGDIVMTSPELINGLPRPSAKDGFDGMNALLRAGEIVGRRHGE
jgi:hypothetical protein